MNLKPISTNVKIAEASPIAVTGSMVGNTPIVKGIDDDSWVRKLENVESGHEQPQILDFATDILQSVGQGLLLASESHVLLVVADNRVNGIATALDDGLHDVAKVVNKEVELGVALGDGAKKTVHDADDALDDIAD
ncbi:hypothetical protein HG530_012439 [Fusarium avenaceum]|nr:hypothetical protein HG530_012439 [Fusarium avenaceum]